MSTDAVARTETAKEYVGGKRLYGNVEGDLLYAYDMAADGPGAPAAHLARQARQRAVSPRDDRTARPHWRRDAARAAATG